MKFAINRDRYLSDSRALILEREEDRYKTGRLVSVYYRPMIIVRVTCDWDEKDLFPIIEDTVSIQYRPKSIYVLNGRYYYKNAQKKREYLTLIETKSLLDYINVAKKYLENDNTI